MCGVSKLCPPPPPEKKIMIIIITYENSTPLAITIFKMHPPLQLLLEQESLFPSLGIDFVSHEKPVVDRVA